MPSNACNLEIAPTHANEEGGIRPQQSHMTFQDGWRSTIDSPMLFRMGYFLVSYAACIEKSYSASSCNQSAKRSKPLLMSVVISQKPGDGPTLGAWSRPMLGRMG